MVEMRGVRKSYDRVVLDDLDLDVEAGEKVVIIGPSGSGKTTVLRVLMTLVAPEAGIVRIDGEALWDMEDGRPGTRDERHMHRLRSEIGMVFQQFNLFPHMTVLRNITLGLERSRGMDRSDAESSARSQLERVGLAGREGDYPWQLSGGQQQRVAIARAIALEPKVLLLDEITSALDPELVHEVLDVVEALATSTSMTMLFVTHEMEFARHVSDRVVMFDHGRIVEQGTPGEIFDHPQERRTQDFLRKVA